MSVRTWILGAALVACLAPPAHGQLQSPAQRRCLLALERAGNAVALALAADVAACVDRAGRGALPAGQTPAQCLAADDGGEVGTARARTSRDVARLCAIVPGFGVPRAAGVDAPSAAAVNGAFAPLVAPVPMFGADLDAAIIAGASDPAGARCQAAAASRAARLVAAHLRAFASCARRGLRHGTIRSRLDLEACAAADPQRRVARAVATFEERVQRECAATSVAGAFPGRCAGATGDRLGACLAADVACAVCRGVNAANGLAASCHRFADGVAVDYCGERPAPTQTIARVWDEEILAAIRRDTPRPTVHARNLFHLSAAMWDAWRAYGGGGTAVVRDEAQASDEPEPDRVIAISFAAYRVLAHRYALSAGAAGSLLHFDQRMETLGLDKHFAAVDGDRPAAVGNRIGAALIALGHADGANEHGDYDDPAYTPVNGPLIVKLGGVVMSDPNRWQPLALDFFVTQNGIPIAAKLQAAIGMRWNQVAPFALTRSDPDDVYLDPGPPPRLGTASDADFKTAAVRMIELASELTPDDGATMDISPGAYGNNPLGTNDGTGHPVNPATGLPYPPQVVKRGDFARVLAEFWADGPVSETPPGHWNVLANGVSDVTPAARKRIGGAGPILSALEWDVKLYLALNGAVHDAAITAWGLKRKYDSVRPISMVRYLASHGQSSDPAGPAYDPMGLPLVPGLIEVITPASSAPGERHEGLRRYTNQIAVRAWPGPPEQPAMDIGGVRWVRAIEWVPYQKNTFVTPAFAGYTSGHSTFSRAAAEVLTAFTGSAYFPGGLGEFVARANQYLTFERGPSTDLRLQWATYYDAADQAGQSRLWGGIHIPADDFIGRVTGSTVGAAAHAKALEYFGVVP